MSYSKLRLVLCLGWLLGASSAWAQGPPITGDKPIMLGANRVVLRSLAEFRQLEQGYALHVPLRVHYLPTASSLVGVYAPLVHYGLPDGQGTAFGDLQLVGKYQFYRANGTGKTFKMLVKTVQTLPTGQPLMLDGISTGQYQGFYSFLAGYESLHYGIVGETGFNYSPMPFFNEWRTKVGFGLPLLKPSYPVKQLNLYFEYQSSYFTAQQRYALFYAQGIQYAVGRVTLDLAVQLPLYQTLLPNMRRRYSLYLGMRCVI